MSEQHTDDFTNDSGEALRPGRSRFRVLLREILFIVALVGIYLTVMLFVLPRLGYET